MFKMVIVPQIITQNRITFGGTIPIHIVLHRWKILNDSVNEINKEREVYVCRAYTNIYMKKPYVTNTS